MGQGFSRNDGTFFLGTDATVEDGFICNDSTFFQGTDTMVRDDFSCNDGTFIFRVLMPRWETIVLPWENRMGRGQKITNEWTL